MIESERKGPRGAVSLAVVAGLLLTSFPVLLGVGRSPTFAYLQKATAWLADRGGLIAVNSRSGRVTASGLSHSLHGHITVREDGTRVVVLDGDQLRLFDTRTLRASKNPPRVRATTIASAKHVYYLVDRVHGDVKLLDPTNRRPTEAWHLHSHLGQPVVDPNGALWVTAEDHGTAKRIVKARKQTQTLKIASAGEHVDMVAAGGRVFAVDKTTTMVTEVTGAHIGKRRRIGENASLVTPEYPLPPGSLFLADQTRGRILKIDAKTRSTKSYDLRGASGSELGHPLVDNGRVYILVRGTAFTGLEVLDASSGRLLRRQRFSITRLDTFDLFAKDRIVWVNDQQSSFALALPRDGGPTSVDKNDSSGLLAGGEGPATTNLPDPSGFESLVPNPLANRIPGRGATSGSGARPGGKNAPITPAPSPPAPTCPLPGVAALRAVPGDGQITLQWVGIVGVASYDIGVAPGPTSGQPGVLPGTTRTIGGLTNGRQYSFTVIPVGSACRGAPAQVVATPVASPLTAVTGLSATPGAGEVSLSWALVAGATGYEIDIAPSPSGWPRTVAGPVTVTGLVNGVRYTFTVTPTAPGRRGPSRQASGTPVARQRTLGFLAFLPGGSFSEANDVNDTGQIVGRSNGTGIPNTHAVRWDASGVLDLGTLGGSQDLSLGHAINSAGAVVGQSDVGTSGLLHAFLWRPGVGMTDLGAPPGANEAFAEDINDQNQIAVLAPPGGINHAYLWDAGAFLDLGNLGGVDTAPTGINNAGQIVGGSGTATSTSHAFLWERGSGMIDLGTLPGDVRSGASSVNDLGQVVGYSESSSGERHAFLWDAASGMTALGTLGGASSEAYAINNDGEVVGRSTLASGALHAFAWKNDNMTDLSPSGTNGEAVAINSGGTIVGNFWQGPAPHRAARWS